MRLPAVLRRVSFGKWVLPVYLALGLIVGGASQEGQLACSVIQMLGAVLLVWCVFDSGLPGPNRVGRLLQVVWVGGCAYALVQLILMPPDLWTSLPGREVTRQGFEALGEADLPFMPISLAPQNTLEGLLRFIPPLTVFVLTYKTVSESRNAILVGVILTIASGSALLGWAQLFDGRDSPLYFWNYSNIGLPVGLMANVNHQASLLLLALPFAAANLSRLRVRTQLGDADMGQLVATLSAIGILTMGVLMAGSVAGYIMLGPVLVLSFLIQRGRKLRSRDGAFAIVALIGLAGLGWWLASSPILPALGVTSLSDEDLGRLHTWRLTASAASDFFPFGSGLGTFEDLIPQYEDTTGITGTYLNHAHNDYLEVWLELGAPGILIIALVLFAIIWASFRTWGNAAGEGRGMKKAASIAVGVAVMHSIVDYPLRTETIAMLVAFALGKLVTERARRLRKSNNETGENGHIVL